MDKLLLFLLGLVMFLLLGAVSSLFIMLGWYLFMVPVVGVKMITFWQAFGLGILSQALIKGTNATISS